MAVWTIYFLCKNHAKGYCNKVTQSRMRNWYFNMKKSDKKHQCSEKDCKNKAIAEIW